MSDITDRGYIDPAVPAQLARAHQRIKALEREVAQLKGFKAESSVILDERDKAHAAIKLALGALEWRVNGFTLREYLKVQFPATAGHIPIELHLDKLDAAAGAIKACGVTL